MLRAAALTLAGLLLTTPPAAAQLEELLSVGHAVGAENAPVVVIEFLDFGCAVCMQFAQSSFPVIREQYVDAGRVRWIAVPFVLGAFRNSEQAARAAACAADQGKFWAMHDALFRDRRWSTPRNPDAPLLELAIAAGADSSAFRACYRDRATTNRVRDARRVALQRKVEGTPTFFINGRRVTGAPPLPLFRRMLEDAAQSHSSAGRATHALDSWRSNPGDRRGRSLRA